MTTFKHAKIKYMSLSLKATKITILSFFILIILVITPSFTPSGSYNTRLVSLRNMSFLIVSIGTGAPIVSDNLEIGDPVHRHVPWPPIRPAGDFYGNVSLSGLANLLGDVCDVVREADYSEVYLGSLAGHRAFLAIPNKYDGPAEAFFTSLGSASLCANLVSCPVEIVYAPRRGAMSTIVLANVSAAVELSSESMESMPYSVAPLLLLSTGSPVVLLPFKAAETLDNLSSDTGLLIFSLPHLSDENKSRLASCVSKAEEELGVNLIAVYIDGSSLASSLTHFVKKEKPVGVYAFELTPVAVAAVMLFGYTPRSEEIAVSIARARGRAFYIVYLPAAAVAVLTLALVWSLEHLRFLPRNSFTGVIYVVLVYLLARLLPWALQRQGPGLSQRLRELPEPLTGVVLLAAMVIIHLALLDKGGLGGLAYLASSTLLGGLGRVYSELSGMAFYESVVIWALYGVVTGVALYLTASWLSDTLSRGISRHVSWSVVAYALVASVFLPVAATGPLALTTGLESTWGANIIVKASPYNPLPSNVSEEISKLASVHKVAPLYLLGVGEAAREENRILYPVVSVACYDDQLLVYLKWASRRSISAFYAYRLLDGSTIYISKAILDNFEELGVEALRLGNTTINLSNARAMPSALEWLGVNALMPCPKGYRPENVVAVLIVGDRGAYEEVRRLVASLAGAEESANGAGVSVHGARSIQGRRGGPTGAIVEDVLGEGVKFISNTPTGETVSALLGLSSLALFAIVMLVRVSSSSEARALSLILRARGARVGLRHALPLLAASAGVAGVGCYLVYLILTPARLGYPVLSTAWYVAGLAASLIAALSPLAFALLAFRAVAGGGRRWS
jgi:hypothetical protein